LEEIYRNNKSKLHGNANVVPVGDMFYGYAGPWDKPSLICLDPTTGDIIWQTGTDAGAFVAVGNNLIMQSATGEIVVTEPSKEGNKEVCRFPALTSPCWTTPSLANGRVYCRNTAGDVVCMDFGGGDGGSKTLTNRTPAAGANDPQAKAKEEASFLKARTIYDSAVHGIIARIEARQQQKQAEHEAAIKKDRDACAAHTAVRDVEAKAHPVSANTIIAIPAESFTAQGSGTVTLTDKKRGIIGKALSGWNDTGHWLEWTFDVPLEGYYNLSICYCSSEMDEIAREIKINGDVQETFAPMALKPTGGWSSQTDDWKLETVINPVNEKPLLLKFKQGRNALRLTNLNGIAANVNYLLITSPDVKLTRGAAEAKLRTK